MHAAQPELPGRHGPAPSHSIGTAAARCDKPRHDGPCAGPRTFKHREGAGRGEVVHCGPRHKGRGVKVCCGPRGGPGRREQYPAATPRRAKCIYTPSQPARGDPLRLPPQEATTQFCPQHEGAGPPTHMGGCIGCRGPDGGWCARPRGVMGGAQEVGGGGVGWSRPGGLLIPIPLRSAQGPESNN